MIKEWRRFLIFYWMKDYLKDYYLKDYFFPTCKL